MAKKPRDEVPNPNSVSNRDIIQRLNFLYQASVYLNSIDGGKIKANDGDADAATARKNTNKRKRVVSTSDLSRSYIKSMKIVGQKTTVKMCVPSPSTPRSFVGLILDEIGTHRSNAPCAEAATSSLFPDLLPPSASNVHVVQPTFDPLLTWNLNNSRSNTWTHSDLHMHIM